MLATLLHKKEAIWNSAQVFLNKGLNAVVPVFLIPYYNKVFGVEQYGELVYVQSIMTLLMFVSDYGFNVTGTRDVSMLGDDKRGQAQLLSNIYAVKFALTGCCYLIIFIMAFIAGWTVPVLLLYLATYSAFAFQSLTPFWFFQGIKQNVLITITNLVSKLLLVGLTLHFIVKGSPLVLAPAIEWISYMAAFLMGNAILLTHLHFRLVRPRLVHIRQQLASGKNIFITSLLNWAITSGALVVLKQYADAEQMGYYGTFVRIIYYVFALLQPINQALFPYVSARFAKGRDAAARLIRPVAIGYFILVMLLLVTGLYGSEMMYNLFFDNRFMQGLPVYLPQFLVLLGWVSLVLINNFLAMQGLVAAGQDHIYRRYYSLNALVAVVLFFVLIPRYSGTGAAWAVFSGEALLTILLIPVFFKATGIKFGSSAENRSPY
ncbi:MAG TPA: oligosaccharide flippase family protein [Cyclobacteriaceae bacterium]|nr:oligosaccharide flippase family protein [Cyclobacteriaceae bacterium]